MTSNRMSEESYRSGALAKLDHLLVHRLQQYPSLPTCPRPPRQPQSRSLAHFLTEKTWIDVSYLSHLARRLGVS